jgi:hypothetical protein
VGEPPHAGVATSLKCIFFPTLELSGMPPKRGPYPRRPSANPDGDRRTEGRRRKVWDRWGPKACYNRSGNIRPPDLHCHRPCRPGVSTAKIAAGKKSAWIRALREFNRSNATWVVPRETVTVNGQEMVTEGYRRVMDIKERIQAEDARTARRERARLEREEQAASAPMLTRAKKASIAPPGMSTRSKSKGKLLAGPSGYGGM